MAGALDLPKYLKKIVPKISGSFGLLEDKTMHLTAKWQKTLKSNNFLKFKILAGIK